MAFGGSLVCSGNNVSTMGGFCLGHQHLKFKQKKNSFSTLADIILDLPQTVNEIFLYSTVSTLKPIVGIVVTISPGDEKESFVERFAVASTSLASNTSKCSSSRYSPNLSLYKIVVLPAASSPTI